jgi:hypothetical protein
VLTLGPIAARIVARVDRRLRRLNDRADEMGEPLDASSITGKLMPDHALEKDSTTAARPSTRATR